MDKFSKQKQVASQNKDLAAQRTQKVDQTLDKAA